MGLLGRAFGWRRAAHGGKQNSPCSLQGCLQGINKAEGGGTTRADCTLEEEGHAGAGLLDSALPNGPRGVLPPKEIRQVLTAGWNKG